MSWQLTQNPIKHRFNIDTKFQAQIYKMGHKCQYYTSNTTTAFKRLNHSGDYKLPH